MSEAIPRFPLQWPAGWPRRSAAHRTRAKFSTKGNSTFGEGGYRAAKSLSVGDGTQRVVYELQRLNVRDDDVVISTNVALRLDGFPRSGQGEPTDPGVAVYWRTRKGETKVMAVDLYDRVADNLAAVAATLEAMRAIERHGGGQILERVFTGFDALPPPKSCWDILGVTPAATEASVQVAWKAKLRTHHPDNGGSHNLMADLNWARDEALKLISQRQA